jgi:hypothetical protein
MQAPQINEIASARCFHPQRSRPQPLSPAVFLSEKHHGQIDAIWVESERSLRPAWKMITQARAADNSA